MRALFFCGHKSRYGFAHIKPLLNSRFEIVGVIAAKDERWKKFRKKMRGGSEDFAVTESEIGNRVLRVAKKIYGKISKKVYPRPSPIEKVCGDLKTYYCSDVNSSDAIETWKELDPDIVISAAYPQIFGADLLSVASVSNVNFHPSALPKYRGAHPHYWVIREGATTTGVTAHRMTTRLDAGAIIAQRRFPCADLTYSELYDQIVQKTPDIVEDVESFYLDGDGKAREQDDDDASYFRNNKTIHSRLFWSNFDCQKAHNLVRTERAFFFVGREKIRIIEARPSADSKNMTNRLSAPPSTIVYISDEGIVVKVKEGFLSIERFQVGDKILGPIEFAKEFHLGIGEMLD